MEIRRAGDRDIPAILELNLESEWALSPLDASDLAALLANTALALVASAGDDVAGFALALAPGADYVSANFRWFSERYSSFLYLDRIAIAARHRRRGIGAAIYEEMEAHARPFGRMCCEVNISPPNDVSLAFHVARGYEKLGTLDHAGGKVVVMLVKELTG